MLALVRPAITMNKIMTMLTAVKIMLSNEDSLTPIINKTKDKKLKIRII